MRPLNDQQIYFLLITLAVVIAVYIAPDFLSSGSSKKSKELDQNGEEEDADYPMEVEDDPWLAEDKKDEEKGEREDEEMGSHRMTVNGDGHLTSH